MSERRQTGMAEDAATARRIEEERMRETSPTATERRAPGLVRETYPEMLAERERVGVAYETWRPTTGGLLEILAGSINTLMGLGILAGAGIFGAFGDIFTNLSEAVAVGAGAVSGGVLLILGIISIIGGALALKRRNFRWAMAGTITALVPSVAWLFGVLSLIFVTLGKPEFTRKAR